MSRRVLRRSQSSLDYIERMVNKTTLTTQRVCHDKIIDVGSGLLAQIQNVKQDSKDKVISEAVQAAEERATRELRAALKRQRIELEDARRRAVDVQKDFYKKLAEKVQEQRDRLEKERLREFERKHEKNTDEALELQKQQMLRERDEAVKAAVAAAKQRLYEELSAEQQKALTDALRQQAAQLKREEQQAVERTKLECAKLAAEMAARVAEQHREEINQMKKSYSKLAHKYKKELDHKIRVENDFLALQTDYKRFLDYSDNGLYHSDFMMKLRHHGIELANKRLSVVDHQLESRTDKTDQSDSRFDDKLGGANAFKDISAEDEEIDKLLIIDNRGT
ncbi:uncharacterized protein LOC141910664 [Tubulanus polymorphus]|uniref:uncharacterized protein LOC141910664 n=1 Tax=Tubulanus polymorphus TaxID=672921 RepID=UPI003DA66888